MRTRMIKLFAALAAVGALAVGGSALAGAAGKQAPPTNPPAAVDTDTLQQGDQTTPDTPGESVSNQVSDPAGQAGSDEATETAEESGSEIVGNDGPGGHADEPGNPNADHQFDGQE